MCCITSSTTSVITSTVWNVYILLTFQRSSLSCNISHKNFRDNTVKTRYLCNNPHLSFTLHLSISDAFTSQQLTYQFLRKQPLTPTCNYPLPKMSSAHHDSSAGSSEQSYDTEKYNGVPEVKLHPRLKWCLDSKEAILALQSSNCKYSSVLCLFYLVFNTLSIFCLYSPCVQHL
jgi:hypothetical protein